MCYHNCMSMYSILCDDSFKILENFEEFSFDCVITDPPYHLSNNNVDTCLGGERIACNKGDWDKSDGYLSDFNNDYKWIRNIQRLLKTNGTAWICCNHHNIPSISHSLKLQMWHIINIITWLKPNPPPNLSCRYFTHSTEFIIWASPARFDKLNHTFRYEELKGINFGRQMLDRWEISPPKDHETKYGRHPTQKPLRLIELMILASTRDGDIVLDPFAGTHTTGVAAAKHNLEYVGIEKNAEYCKIGERRIDDMLSICSYSDVTKP